MSDRVLQENTGGTISMFSLCNGGLTFNINYAENIHLTAL